MSSKPWGWTSVETPLSVRQIWLSLNFLLVADWLCYCRHILYSVFGSFAVKSGKRTLVFLKQRSAHIGRNELEYYDLL